MHKSIEINTHNLHYRLQRHIRSSAVFNEVR